MLLPCWHRARACWNHRAGSGADACVSKPGTVDSTLRCSTAPSNAKGNALCFHCYRCAGRRAGKTFLPGILACVVFASLEKQNDTGRNACATKPDLLCKDGPRTPRLPAFFITLVSASAVLRETLA